MELPSNQVTRHNPLEAKQRKNVTDRNVPFLECFVNYDKLAGERDLPRSNLLGASRYNSAKEDAIAFALSNNRIWPSLQ